MDPSSLTYLLKKPSESIVKGVVKEFRHIAFNRLLEYREEEFKRCLRTKTVLHRVKPVNLLEIYVPLKISRNKTYLENLNILESEEENYTIGNEQDVLKLLLNHQFLTLNGLAGGGKSTLIKFFFIAIARGSDKIPIKLDFRDLNDFKPKKLVGTGDSDRGNYFLEYLDEKVFSFHKLSEDLAITKRLLDSGMFFFLLDGYDELNSLIINTINKDFEAFSRRFGKNHYVMTSRPFTLSESFISFDSLWVEDLSPQSVNEFILKQKFEKKFENKIIEAISSVRGTSYEEFLMNPLLLAMFVLTYDSYPNIPTKKHLYYRQVFDSLYSIHDSISKKGYEREIKCGLAKDDFETILNGVSFISFFRQSFKFSYSNLLDVITEARSNRELEFESEDFIHDLLTSVNLLIKEEGSFKFIHRSLQEYFAANYIKSLSAKNKVALYQHIIDQVINTKPFLNELSNFYSIINEVDKKDFIKYFEIPFISKMMVFIINGIDQDTFEKVFLSKLHMISALLGMKSIRIRQSSNTMRNGNDIEVQSDRNEWETFSSFLSRMKKRKMEEVKISENDESRILKKIMGDIDSNS